MVLNELLRGVDFQLVGGSLDNEIKDITNDSRKISYGSLFFCIRGFNVDSHKYIEECASNNASAIICEEVENDVIRTYPKIAFVRVSDSRAAMALISANFYGRPAEKLKTIAVTGTKGKTTTTTMIRDALEKSGIKTGLIGTVSIIDGKSEISASHTTPESINLHRYLKNMLDNGCEAVVMETSSQGFKLKRTYGINFDIGVFTNIEPDHIGENEHPDLNDYIESKKLLFKSCKLGIYNMDADYLDRFLDGHTCKLSSYSVNDSKAEYYADDIQLLQRESILGSSFNVGNEKYELSIPGRFNIYNALATIAVCKAMNISYKCIYDSLLDIQVKGRCQVMPISKDYILMIDYAHNAMALESLLKTLKEYDLGRLIVVFGCGGNRAISRRYEMGEVAGNLADLTIITSDNPRYEKPMKIINDIVIGMKKTHGEYIIIPDRIEAIHFVMDNAVKGDVIVLAGKGHESYQEIKGVKHDMDEEKIVLEYGNVR